MHLMLSWLCLTKNDPCLSHSSDANHTVRNIYIFDRNTSGSRAYRRWITDILKQRPKRKWAVVKILIFEECSCWRLIWSGTYASLSLRRDYFLVITTSARADSGYGTNQIGHVSVVFQTISDLNGTHDTEFKRAHGRTVRRKIIQTDVRPMSTTVVGTPGVALTSAERTRRRDSGIPNQALCCVVRHAPDEDVRTEQQTTRSD